MQPVLHERLTRGALALGNFVVVMREHVVNAAGVHIEALTEVLHAHCRTLDMPAGPAAAPRGIPDHLAIFLCPCFPQGKVRGAFLLVLVLGNTRPRLESRGVDPCQATVVLELGNAEVDRAIIRAVCQPLVEQLADQLDHLRHMVRCRRIVLCRFNIEGLDVLEEHILVGLRVVAQGHPGFTRPANRLVVHVRQVHHLRHLETAVLEIASEEILEHVGSEIADVGGIVNRRPAGIEADMVILEWHDLLKLP